MPGIHTPDSPAVHGRSSSTVPVSASASSRTGTGCSPHSGYDNFDIILNHFLRLSSFMPPPTRVNVLHFVPMLIGCRLVLAIRCHARSTGPFQVREQLRAEGVDDVVVIDSPYLSHATEGLRQAVRGLDAVVFADVCKHGQHPLAGIVTELHGDGQLPAKWQCVAALPTYNPLGSTITFTSEEDIYAACSLALGH